MTAVRTRTAEPIAAAGFVIMWSSGFVGAELGTAEAGALTLLMWRFLVIAVLLGAWWVWRRPRLTLSEVVVQAVIGLLSQGVYLFGVLAAVGYGVSAGTSALVTALQPIVAGALAGPLLKERTSGRQWLGLAVGLAGVVLVVGADLRTRTGTPAWAYLLPFLAMAGVGGATPLERKLAPAVPLRDALPVQCLTSAVVFTALASSAGQSAPPA